MINSRDLTIQFNITRLHHENLLKDLLAEMTGFKFQITLKVTFCKKIENGETKYSHKSISIIRLKRLLMI